MSRPLNVGSGSNNTVGNQALNNPTQDNNNQLNFSTKIRQMIQGCNYANNNKPQVEKAAILIYRQYNLECGILNFSQNSRIANYLEMSGKIPVQFKGALYPVMVRLFFPERYPDVSPLLRIINTDPDKCVSIEDYKPYLSPVDPCSYTLNKLPSIINWNKYLDIRTVIYQAGQMMSARFPFRKKQSQQAENYFHSMNSSQNNQPTYNSNPNASTYTTLNSNPNINQPTNTNNFTTITTISPQVCRDQLNNLSQNTQKLTDNACKHAEKLQTNFLSTFSSIQRMNITDKCLLDEIHIVQNNLTGIKSFLTQSESVGANFDLKNCVSPADPISKELLQYVASKKTLDDIILLLESRFADGKIDLQTFIRLIRKYQEERFQTWETMRRISKAL